MKPNILYISDNYAKNVHGTKISIYNEMVGRNCNIVWIDKKYILQNDFILKIIKERDINQIWLVHSSLTLSVDFKNYLYGKNIAVVGFGMSDPYYFESDKRFSSCDIYVTNSIEVYNQYKLDKPIIYNPTACDFNFHCYKNYPKNIYSSVVGVGKHPRFLNKEMRIDIVNFLKNNNIGVKTYGRQWGMCGDFAFVEGQDFLNTIWGSHVGLDLQEVYSPLAHRMFEYSACGTPVITRKREEVSLHFNETREILTYGDKEELLDKLKFYQNKEFLLDRIGYNAYLRCKKDHNITNRVDNLLQHLNILV